MPEPSPASATRPGTWRDYERTTEALAGWHGAAFFVPMLHRIISLASSARNSLSKRGIELAGILAR